MSTKQRNYFKQHLGESFKERAEGTRYRERTGITYLPAVSAEMMRGVGKLWGPNPVLVMWLIIQDSKLRHREHDLKVSGKRRDQLGIGVAQFNTELRKLDEAGWINVTWHKAKCHRIQLTDKSKDLMRELPPMVHQKKNS